MNNNKNNKFLKPYSFIQHHHVLSIKSMTASIVHFKFFLFQEIAKYNAKRGKYLTIPC